MLTCGHLCLGWLSRILAASVEEGGFMAVKETQTDPVLAAANVALAKRLLAKLEAAHREGRLKPVNPNAKSMTEEIRIKVA